MITASVYIPPELVETISQSIVVTPNERLARELSASFDLTMRDNGYRAWPALQCQSLRHFWRGLYEQARDSSLTQADVLSELQIQLGFQQTAPQGLRHQCRSVIQAWQLVKGYGIELHMLQQHSEQGAYFSQWCDEATSTFSADTISEAELPFLLLERISDIALLMPKPIVLVDVEHLSPIETKFFSTLDDLPDSRVNLLRDGSWLDHFHPSLNIKTEALTEVRLTSSQQVKGFDTFAEELADAAKWCHDVYCTDANARIGIVIPDLSVNYDRVLRQFAATLSPSTDSMTPIFDLSGGKSLSGMPVWRHARLLLDWVREPLDQSQMETLLSSPFLSLPWCRELRHQWPRWARLRLPINAFTNNPEARSMLALVNERPSRARLDIWIQRFLDILHAANWPKIEDLGSVQYQAVAKIQERLSELAAERETTLLLYDEALELIDWGLDQTFAPERQTSRIQILGMLETTGLTFSHLWVCGMSAELFPGKSKLSPFIPRSIALAHGLPRCTQQLELAFAERTLGSWVARSQELMLSYTRQDKGAQLSPSPLSRGFTAAQQAAIEPHTLTIDQRHPFMQQSNALLTLTDDARGSPLAAGEIRGGSGRLENHAICPFKEFAIYRLNLAEPNAPRDFLSAMERGQALHWVMEQLFTRYPNSEDAVACPASEVKSWCQAAVQKYPHLPGIFADAEQYRLMDLVIDWLTIEHERKGFRAIEVEKYHCVTLGKLTFNLRIDRLDEVDGKVIVVDYKTGNATVGDALSETLRAPQLPIYSQIRDDISGVYYAKVKQGDHKLIGVGDALEQLVSSKNAQIKTSLPNEGWDSQRNLWQQQLVQLSNEIAAGEARVDPLQSACRSCHLKSVCRIAERRRQRKAEE